MANSKGSSNIRNFMYSGKHALLPPKSPFPSVSSSYVDYVPSGLIGSKSIPKPKESNTYHQRTSSETFLVEEQPSWLDDLLNEPETPVRRGGHRRSSSDSFAYVDVGNISNIHYAAHDDFRYKNTMPLSPWGSQDFDYNKDAQQTYVNADVNLVKPKNWTWDSNLKSAPNSGGFPSARESIVSTGLSCATQVVDGVLSSTNEKQDPVDSAQHDPKSSSEKKDGALAKLSASSLDNDTKRAKQQFAQRSRVRKLQYIAELERNVQALQAEGSEVSAELDFLNQQHLILSMENKALKHRLESLAQEQLLKYVEHEVLEKETGRLRALYQQQNQPQQPQSRQKQHQPSSHRRTNSRDLESQFGTLSLKNKDTNSGRESVTGSLRI